MQRRQPRAARVASLVVGLGVAAIAAPLQAQQAAPTASLQAARSAGTTNAAGAVGAQAETAKPIRKPPAAVGSTAPTAAVGSAAQVDGPRVPGMPPGPMAPPIADDDAMPEGHPAVDDSNPHAHAAHGSSAAMPGVFDPPPDLEQEDPLLPPGTIAVDLRDADDKPVPGEMVTLGILLNSVAKGDSRKHVQALTDANGRAVFGDLETAASIAYRVSSGYQGGAFAAAPFQMAQTKAMHVVLHVYPVARSISQALIVCEAVVAAELRDDRIQIEEALTVYNLGRTAWQPDDVRLALPEGFTAFNGQATMSDQAVDEVGGAGKLRGTFPPGRHPVEFRWQLPWSGDKDVDFEVGLPPHVAIARVMMLAAAKVKLVAADFPPPDVRHDEQGQTFLVTEKRLKPDDARLASLSIGIHDLPTPGGGRLLASLIAACAIATGLVFAFSGRKRDAAPDERDRRAARQALLEELGELERARTSGQVGPRTYDRVRRDLVEALAHTLISSP